ncbi:MAG: chorismate mutase [Methanomicrobiaceae archaeon]|nr:chorismate mutase [Methanomicrobiaceae archaeon]
MTLEAVREEVRRLDDEIIELIARRQHLARTIARLKYEARIPIQDKDQRAAVLERAFTRAVESQIDPMAVRRIFEILIEMNEERQRECSGDGNLP